MKYRDSAQNNSSGPSVVMSRPPSAVSGKEANSSALQKAARSPQATSLNKWRVSRNIAQEVSGQTRKVAARTPSSPSPNRIVPAWISQATIGGLE